jgi:hypothetical protein
VENNGGNVENNLGGNDDMEQENIPDAQESMVLHPSGGSISSVNSNEEVVHQPGNINLDLALGLVANPLHHVQGNNQVLQVGMMVHGPSI